MTKKKEINISDLMWQANQNIGKQDITDFTDDTGQTFFILTERQMRELGIRTRFPR